MSRKNKVILSCSTCNHQFEATLYRTIWGESQENRDLLMNNLINVVVCPSCNTKTKIEYALFYNDTTVLCGVWWEPYPESEIDQCAAGWAKMFGKDNYMTNAPRLKDWNEFIGHAVSKGDCARFIKKQRVDIACSLHSST